MDSSNQSSAYVPRFAHRQEAGIELARLLLREEGLGHLPPQDRPTLVLGLLRGGVPVAREVAFRLRLPWDIYLVRKIGAPGNPELALGAIEETGVFFKDPALATALHVLDSDFAVAKKQAKERLENLILRHRSALALGPLRGERVLLVDDGLATGATARAVARGLRAQGVARIELAVPVASQEGLEAVQAEFDRVHVLEVPSEFWSVGIHYRDFEAVTDAVVEQARRDTRVRIPEFSQTLPVRLFFPKTFNARRPPLLLGYVLFSPGLGSGLNSPRNRIIAEALAEEGVLSLVPQLLTEDESRPGPSESNEETTEVPFRTSHTPSIPELAERLRGLTQWLRTRTPRGAPLLPLGLMGSSFGAAPAAWLAADPQAWIDTLCCRGGRLDLVAAKLRAIQCPTLLIVGEHDSELVEINRQARRRLARGALALIPEATHLFVEPGTLEEVAHQCRGWFRDHFTKTLSVAA